MNRNLLHIYLHVIKVNLLEFISENFDVRCEWLITIYLDVLTIYAIQVDFPKVRRCLVSMFNDYYNSARLRVIISFSLEFSSFILYFVRTVIILPLECVHNRYRIVESTLTR